MLRTRLITAAIAIPLLIWLVFWAPAWMFNLLVLTATFLMLREFAAMALAKLPGATTMVTFGGMVIALAMGLGQSGAAVSAGITVCLTGVLLRTLATANHMERSVNTAAHILLGALYGGVLLPHFIWLRALPGNGPSWVLLVLACSMAGDAGGYFGGAALGRRKLWPQVSPNKTVEGALVSFVCSLVAGAVVNLLVLRELGGLELLAVAGILNVLAQLGDLLESMLKRAYDAKDSGWILPGHGGVLDRTDSLVLPIVFAYYYAKLAIG